MDAVEYIEELKRMIDTTGAKRVYVDKTTNAANCVESVRAWAKEHPRKTTRQNEFLKHFPNAPIDPNGGLLIHPCALDRTYRKTGPCADENYAGTCRACARAYWQQEVDG